MANKRARRAPGLREREASRGEGGETHQRHERAGDGDILTTNQGVAVSDNQNTLRADARGPALLEDFVFREKITHFDHERIPERIVHARGSGAHGHFQVYKSLRRLTKARFLCEPDLKTRVFVRFSTVAGGAGSIDTARDVRGFAVKFYTEEGNFDLVGNNIPVFFIQDPIKFPDVIHAVKPEPDRGFPQAASAHDTFWDFVSLLPESMHMLMWVMSDRAIPRSYRTMEGFGVHTFRLVNAEGESTFVKFHWRPILPAASLVWDEAVKIAGADCDYHRRDLWQTIDRGDVVEYELCLQTFDQAAADAFEFDVLDPTKLIPEEAIPLQRVGKLVLDRNPDNFFAETEQVAFCPANLVPGIEFSDDPLLQGRLFSYLDTQLRRLGGPNFHEIPINAPLASAVRNNQRDGIMRTTVPKGRVAYEPNSLDPNGPREDPRAGFVTFPQPVQGAKLRLRPESFADHYSQARMFWRSMTEPEQHHIVSAYAFELGKVETRAIRRRMLGHLHVIDTDLGTAVEEALGMVGEAEAITPAREPVELEPSPQLSLIAKAEESLAGRMIAALVTHGTDASLLESLVSAAKAEDAQVAVVAPWVGGVRAADGSELAVDHSISTAPSVLFDAVALLPSAEGAAELATQAAAVDWLRDAYAHLKAIAAVPASAPLFEAASIAPDGDDGIVLLSGDGGLGSFVAAARRHRIWEREPSVRPPGSR